MGTLNEDEELPEFIHDPLDMSDLEERWFNFYFERMISQVERACAKAS